MFKIVVVGEEELILGFRGIDAELINVDSSEELNGVLERLVHDTTISLIMITETMAEDCLEKISNFRERSSAILLLIPAHTGSLNLSLQEMRLDVEKAAGIDLLK
ncbi:MAG: V-type ATP synthase subunit F [Candidatus Scalinduaceae bacterium]